MTGSIEFIAEEIDFVLPADDFVIDWIQQTIKRHKKDSGNISIVFCSDDYLLGLNRKFLEHDFLTDILTFPLNEGPASSIEGDIFISIDRVKENAKTFGQTEIDELHRVIIHGILHLIGFTDETPHAENEMRRQEDIALGLRMF